MAGERGKLGRILGEVLLITMSILLAFSLEAWWSERSAKSEFFDAVFSVRAEFEGVGAELDRARVIHTSTAATLESLLDLMGPEASSAEGDSLLALWTEIRFTSTDPPRGILLSMLARGALSDLAEMDLEGTLSSWPAELEDHLATERMYEDALEHLRLTVSRLSPIPPGSGDFDYLSAFAPRPLDILTDFETENAVTRSLLLLRVALRENEALGERVEKILADLDLVLENR